MFFTRLQGRSFAQGHGQPCGGRFNVWVRYDAAAVFSALRQIFHPVVCALKPLKARFREVAGNLPVLRGA